MKLVESIGDFLDFLRKKKKSSITVARYLSSLNEFVDFLKGDRPILKIKQKNLLEFVDYINDRDIKSNSRALYISALRSFLSYLSAFKGIKHLKYQDLKVPRKEYKIYEYVGDCDYAALIKAIPQFDELHIRNKCIIELIAECGLWLNEVIAIKKEDIDFKKHLLYIKNRDRGKRVLEVPINVVSLIEKYLLKKSQPSEVLFSTLGRRDLQFMDDNLSGNSLQQYIRHYAQDAGIKAPITPLILRHTFALKCLSRGMSLERLQIILGHKALRNTQFYKTYYRRILLAKFQDFIYLLNKAGFKGEITPLHLTRSGRIVQNIKLRSYKFACYLYLRHKREVATLDRAIFISNIKPKQANSLKLYLNQACENSKFKIVDCTISPLFSFIVIPEF